MPKKAAIIHSAGHSPLPLATLARISATRAAPGIESGVTVIEPAPAPVEVAADRVREAVEQLTRDSAIQRISE